MSRPTPTVSVVIPAYNAADYVESAVRSALSQTLPPNEVVCVDDGSTDGTWARLGALVGRFPERVRAVRQPNAGPSAARNRGLDEVTADYVQFLDADDVLDRDKLERQVALAVAAPTPADLVVSGYRTYWADPSDLTEVAVADDVWTGLLTSSLGITSSNLCRTDAVRRVGGWREDLATSEDPDLWFRLLESGATVALDPSPRATLWRRPDSQWNRDELRSLEGWVRLRGRVWRHMQDAGLDTPERRRSLEEAGFRFLGFLADLVGRRRALSILEGAGVPFFPHGRGRVYKVVFWSVGFRAAESLNALDPRGSDFALGRWAQALRRRTRA